MFKSFLIRHEKALLLSVFAVVLLLLLIPPIIFLFNATDEDSELYNEYKEQLCTDVYSNVCFILVGCSDSFPDTETCEMAFRKADGCLKGTVEQIETCNKFLKKVTCDTVPSERDPCLELLQ